MGALVALLEIWQIMTIAGDRWVMAFARNHWLRSRHVRTGSMVSRCSPVWVEARGTSTAQNQLQLLKDSFTNHRNFWLKGGCYFPSLEFAICPVVGLFANGIR